MTEDAPIEPRFPEDGETTAICDAIFSLLQGIRPPVAAMILFTVLVAVIAESDDDPSEIRDAVEHLLDGFRDAGERMQQQ